MYTKWEVLLPLFIVSTGVADDLEAYLKERQELLQQEENLSMGSRLNFTEAERAFNSLLMELKNKELAQDFRSAEFPGATSFLSSRLAYEKSAVFQVLKTMPKGGILHIHDITMTSVDWLVSNATYRDHLYMRQTEEDGLEFRFLAEEVAAADWTSVAAARARKGHHKFDKWLKKKLLMSDGHRLESINEVWLEFTRCLRAALGIITFLPVFTDYFNRALTEAHEDGVQYMEFRTTLPPVYNLDGSSLDPGKVTELYKNIADEFASGHADWCGVKMIYAPIRSVPTTTLKEDLTLAQQLVRQFPEFVAGFDLVAQEDLGRPLLDFIGPLLEARPQLNYFFHAGETDWDWSSTDLNLADAILLNTTRIGHGYALVKHPRLLSLARERNIPVEVCPISNQVLGLVSDLRNHPAATLVKSNFPLVISSDDPAVWGALPLSHDFYAALMAIGGCMEDLRFVKQLALSSLAYSSLEPARKEQCQVRFLARWDSFIQDQLASLYPLIDIVI